ncbi:MAG: signal peptidase I [Gammaproteobacteria bacterium]|nr:signal peptidase I [Gammaproteobacteria bacterium]
MDFSLVLFVLVCATGLIWGLDRFAWAGARARAAKAAAQSDGDDAARRAAAKEPLYVEYARAFFPVILIVFLLRSFVVEPFRIPSGSMLPSLHIGDFILVNKFSYGLRLPVINKKIIPVGDPQRGDVIVFRFPGDESVNYIKRVIGLPGDRVVYEGKKIYVNGRLMPYEPIGQYTVQQNDEPQYSAVRNLEKLDGVEHEILLSSRVDLTPPPFVVPAGHYFVMGDNRDHSNDSRYWGYVPQENLVGKAFLIWFSCDYSHQGAWPCPRVAFDRIGNIIH